MRISVCEFLRLQTNQNWYYSAPGVWINSDNSRKAIRQASDTYDLFYKERHTKTLTYFEGLPSNVVRKMARKMVKVKRR